MPVDRLLLVAILVVQLLILWRTGSQPGKTVGSEPSRDPVSAPVADVEPAHAFGAARPATVSAAATRFPAPPLLFDNHMEQMMADALAQFEQIERLLFSETPWTALPPSPTMEMRDQGDSYVVLLSLPGADPRGILVTLDGRLLTVANRRRRPAGAARLGSFERRIWLPGPVRTDDYATAVLTNGVLKVTIPKDMEAGSAARPGREV